MPYVDAKNERFATTARDRVVVGDLFDHPIIVVPIKTLGRWYGSISRAVVDRGVRLPELAITCAELRTAGERSYVFVTLWDDEKPYSPKHIYDCTRSCLALAAREKLATLAFPFLGGNEGRKFLGAMEQAVDDAMDDCAEAELAMPDVVFVTDHELV